VARRSLAEAANGSGERTRGKSREQHVPHSRSRLHLRSRRSCLTRSCKNAPAIRFEPVGDCAFPLAPIFAALRHRPCRFLPRQSAGWCVNGPQHDLAWLLFHQDRPFDVVAPGSSGRQPHPARGSNPRDLKFSCLRDGDVRFRRAWPPPAGSLLPNRLLRVLQFLLPPPVDALFDQFARGVEVGLRGLPRIRQFFILPSASRIQIVCPSSSLEQTLVQKIETRGNRKRLPRPGALSRPAHAEQEEALRGCPQQSSVSSPCYHGGINTGNMTARQHLRQLCIPLQMTCPLVPYRPNPASSLRVLRPFSPPAFSPTVPGSRRSCVCAGMLRIRRPSRRGRTAP
jgi:hypothetical protein